MKQMDVLLALKALVVSALPGATVLGFDGDTSVPELVPDGGAVIGFPGEPGEPEVDLSPLAYNYEHQIPLQVAADDAVKGAGLVAMLEAIGAAVAADRTLGGLCEWLEAGAPEFADRYEDGVNPNWADLDITAHYSTLNPLA